MRVALKKLLIKPKLNSMIKELNLCIPGQPISKARHKLARRGKFIHMYNPQHKQNDEFKQCVIQQLPKNFTCFNGLVKIEIIFHIARPKSHYGTGKKSDCLKLNMPLYPMTKPDIDNYTKYVYDCFNQVIWEDDSLVYESRERKVYSNTPKTLIHVIGEYTNG